MVLKLKKKKKNKINQILLKNHNLYYKCTYKKMNKKIDVTKKLDNNTINYVQKNKRNKLILLYN